MDKVVHFEIPAGDVERAQRFYREIFKWDIREVSMPGRAYYIVTTVATDEARMPKETGAINGGLYPRREADEKPVIVIEVDDINGYLQKIEAAGGKMVMPAQPVGDMGFYARFQDPEGNVVGLWQDRQ